MPKQDNRSAPDGATQDLSPTEYRAIIEGLLRFTDIGDAMFHRRELLQRAYDAVGVETETKTLFLRGHFPTPAVLPLLRQRNSFNYDPHAKRDGEASS